MSECLDTDAILEIGHALEWNIEEGLSHLQTCAECRRQLEILQRTREGLLGSTPVGAETLQRVSEALLDARRAELRQEQRWTPLRQAADACAAGVVALLILLSNGVPVDSPGPAAVGFSLGAILMVAGTALVRRLPALGAHGLKM